MRHGGGGAACRQSPRAGTRRAAAHPRLSTRCAAKRVRSRWRRPPASMPGLALALDPPDGRRTTAFHRGDLCNSSRFAVASFPNQQGVSMEAENEQAARAARKSLQEMRTRWARRWWAGRGDQRGVDRAGGFRAGCWKACRGWARRCWCARWPGHRQLRLCARGVQGPTLLPSDIPGLRHARWRDAAPSCASHAWPVFTQLLLADEINRAINTSLITSATAARHSLQCLRGASPVRSHGYALARTGKMRRRTDRTRVTRDNAVVQHREDPRRRHAWCTRALAASVSKARPPGAARRRRGVAMAAHRLAPSAAGPARPAACGTSPAACRPST